MVFRSTDFPKMKFNQFMMLPYFHDGVPHDQTLWIDELAVGAKRIGASLRLGRSRWESQVSRGFGLPRISSIACPPEPLVGLSILRVGLFRFLSRYLSTSFSPD